MPGIFLSIVILFTFSANCLHSQTWDQYKKLIASDRANDDWLGYSVAISGDFAFVSAPIEDHDTLGANFISGAGSVYIYKKNGGAWSLVKKIVPADRGTNDNFGFAISAWGDYAVISANSDSKDSSGGGTLLTLAGSVYLFKNNAGEWSQVQKITASDREQAEQFGTALSIDGNYLAVGVPAEDEGLPGDDTLSFAGAVYMFVNNAGVWTETQKIFPADRELADQFGRSVSISGNYLFVGASMEDHNSAGGDFLSNAGSIYVYQNIAGTWTYVQKIVASDRAAEDNLGYKLSASGDYLIAGAWHEDHNALGIDSLPDAGSAYVFRNIAGTWTQVQKITPTDRGTDDLFGSAVSVSGDYAIIGSYQEDEDESGLNTLSNAGSAYVFQNTGGVWSQTQKINSLDRGAGDLFGFSVSIDGGNFVAGAYNEDHDTVGAVIRTNAGAAYIFGNALVLPVELLSFSASCVNNEVHLNWQTAVEINNYGFVVERKIVSSAVREEVWESIAFVNGNGNSNSVKSYSFVDKNISVGKSFYRLKQIDNDGRYEYSQIVETDINQLLRFELAQNYPNPFNPITSISYSLPKESKVKLVICNIIGEEVATLIDEVKSAGINMVQFNSTGLSSGIYFYTLTAEGVTLSKKLTILK